MIEEPAPWKVPTHATRAYSRLLGIAAACSDKPSRLPELQASRRPFENPAAGFQQPLGPDAEGETWKPGKAVNRDLTLLRPYCDPEYTLEFRQAIANRSVGQLTVGNARGSRELLAELDALKKLPHGWDSYSAPAPSPAAVRNAKALLIEAAKLGAEPERVEPSAMGGVGVTFSAGRREVVVEFYNNATAHALFSDDATGEMGTRAVPTSRDGCRGIIDEVGKHLYGEKTAT